MWASQSEHLSFMDCLSVRIRKLALPQDGQLNCLASDIFGTWMSGLLLFMGQEEFSSVKVRIALNI